MTKPLTFLFKDDGKVPNNPALPALVYKNAVDLSGDPAAAIEKLFTENSWGRGLWRDGIFPFVHYHAMIHEALGIARGTARVQLGGHRGETLELKAGDIAGAAGRHRPSKAAWQRRPPGDRRLSAG